MTPSQKTIIAAILAVAMVAVPLIGYGSDAEETADTPEIDKDLGVIWSYGFQFEFQGSGANAIRWNFGDGSEPLTTTQSRVPHVPDLGGKAGDTFTLKVTVLDDNVLVGERTKTYSVGDVDVPADPGSDEEGSEIMSLLSEYMYILAPIVVILLAIVGAVSRKGKKKRK